MIKVVGVIFVVIILCKMFIGPAYNFINNLVQGGKAESEERLIGLVSRHNPRVEEIQRILKDAHFDPGSVDGVMGVQTRRAIRDFQKTGQLRATGKIDSATRAALNKEKEEQGKYSKD
jgi:peptidoglycan hydrolase-like protein with peptidoglycan-binding domain